jgi:hypothetical protein
VVAVGHLSDGVPTRYNLSLRPSDLFENPHSAQVTVIDKIKGLKTIVTQAE